MKLGIGSYTYPWAIGASGMGDEGFKDPVMLIRKAVVLGVDVVQFCDNLPLTALSIDELERLCEIAREFGIAIEVGTRGIERDNIVANLEVAKRVKSSIVRVVLDHGTSKPSYGEIVDSISSTTALFEEADVILAIENHDRFRSSTLVSILNALRSTHVGICLDTVNSMGSLEMPSETIAALAPYAVNLHIKDFRIERIDSNLGFVVSGCPSGRGMLDIPWVLSQTTRSATMSGIIELWTPWSGDLQSTIALEDAWASESVLYMRSLLPAVPRSLQQNRCLGIPLC